MLSWEELQDVNVVHFMAHLKRLLLNMLQGRRNKIYILCRKHSGKIHVMWITEWHVVQWILHNICRYMESTRNTNKHIQFLWKEIHNVVTNIFMCKHIPCLSVYVRSCLWRCLSIIHDIPCLFNIWDRYFIVRLGRIII